MQTFKASQAFSWDKTSSNTLKFLSDIFSKQIID